ncbi:leucine-rich repeat domain-containing protein [Candidatus Neomarinimicrobiota bacterium]
MSHPVRPLISILIICLVQTTAAQAPDTLWTKTYGTAGNEILYSIDQTTDGGFIMSGIYGYFSGSDDYWLVRTDALGDTLWTRTYGGPGEDRTQSGQLTADGGYIMAGLGEMWLIRTDGDGDTLWTLRSGGPGGEESPHVALTNDGNYVITGTFNDTTNHAQVGIVKVDDEGTILWTKTWGDVDDQYGVFVQPTTDDGYVVLGYKDITDNNHEFWLLKTDAAGDTSWTTVIPTVDGEANVVRQTADGGYAIFGLIFGTLDEPVGDSEAVPRDWLLIKTDASGAVQWSETYGTLGNDQSLGMIVTSDDGFLLTGWGHPFDLNDEDFWLVQTDASGVTVWDTFIGATGMDMGVGLVQLADGEYAIAGGTASMGAGNLDGLLVRLGAGPTPFEADSLALVDLYYATGGGTDWSASNWNTSTPLSSWEAVTVTNGRVTELRLYQHNLTGTIPASFADLTALTDVRLGSNQLGVFPEAICQLTNLESLWLIHMAITAVPDAVGNLVNLRELILDYNEITTLPTTIGSLTSLESLSLPHNMVASLPTQIGSLISLTQLALGNNQLTAIPDEIIGLTNLTLLDLYLNQLSGELTAGIGGLTNLTHLALYGNQLTGVPEIIGNLTSLQYLDLADNLLPSIPGGIGNLTSLTDLRLNGNQLTVLPDTLGRLGSLQHLYLYGNQISTTPARMNQLGSLISLELSDNLLPEVPNWVTDLPNLQFLMLYDNNIETLDEWINNLPAITGLYLYGNNIEDLPDLSALNNTLTDFRIMDNQLMFDDIIHVMEELPGATIIYNWQDSIGIVMDIAFIEGTTLELNVEITPGNNHYQWGKFGTIPAGTVTDSSILVIPGATQNDAGDYWCAVTNTDVPDLTLYTHLMHVTITEDMLPADSLVVVALYDSLDGDNWVLPEWFTPWDPGTPISEWGGIVVTDNRITQLNLYNLGLSGTIPPIIGDLSEVWYLDFGWGTFTGGIPEEIGNLTKLTLLLLDHGGWQVLPEFLGTMTGLTSLSLQQNEISGPIPAWMLNLTNLTTWQLDYNNFTGPLPAGMDTLPNLAFLDLKHNNFTFEDIIPLLDGDWTVYYAPQGKIGIERDQAVLVGEPLILASDGAGSGHQYQWNKDGLPIVGATDSVYTKAVAEYSDAGDYTLEVTNAAASELTLNSLPIHVSVVEDPILPFYLISPANNSSVIIANSNVANDSLIFEWESTTDLGGDPVFYGALIDDGLNTVLTISSTTGTRIPIAYTDIAEALRVASVLSVGGYWQIYATDGSADTTWAADGPYQLTIDASTLDVLVQALLPTEFALHPAYPNPFNPSTNIRFDLPVTGEISLIVYDILGREVAELASGLQPAGYHQLRWSGRAANGSSVPTGMYFARLVTPEYSKSIKMLLLK